VVHSSETTAGIKPNQYDDHAEQFAAHMESQPYNVLYERPATRALIGDVADLDVLDVACGAGALAEDLIASGARLVGGDASQPMLDLARKRIGDDVPLHHQDCSDPFTWASDASFDLVVMALAYHYVNDHASFLREMHRVLRPDGSLVISTHHPTDDFRRLGGSYFAKELNTDIWGTGDAVVSWRMPLAEMTEQFADAGFLIERIVEPRPLPEMAAQDPEVFEKLERCPAFILFRLIKAPKS
jgi:SAM-dependent methyltransferase